MGRVPLNQMCITGHAFVVAELLDIEVELPREVHDGCYLDRAPEASLDFLSDWVGRFFYDTNLFEVRRDPETKRLSPLPRSDWRYYLLRRDSERIPQCIVHAAAILTPSLFLGPYLYNLDGSPSFGHYANISAKYSSIAFGESKAVVSESLIAQWAETSKLLSEVDRDYPEISRVVKMFWMLSGRDPLVEPLTVLGYFAVIEALLTHQPKPDDTIDSITRQIYSKMILLGNRRDTTLDYGKFGVSEPKKVWQTLYSFRSALAHGAKPDFKNKLKPLRDQKTAVDFVESACREVLRHALKEPKLFTDLKNC